MYSSPKIVAMPTWLDFYVKARKFHWYNLTLVEIMKGIDLTHLNKQE